MSMSLRYHVLHHFVVMCHVTLFSGSLIIFRGYATSLSCAIYCDASFGDNIVKYMTCIYFSFPV